MIARRSIWEFWPREVLEPRWALCSTTQLSMPRRRGMPCSRYYPKSQAFPTTPGKLNGKPFQTIRDADPEIGARLEVYAAGAYLWIPFQHIASVQMQAPQCLRDTLWAPAVVLTGPTFNGTDIGQVIIPAIYPFSWKSDDEALWLGRSTEWVADDEGHEFPVGQKMFIVDDEEVPLLEIRSLEFLSDATA
jgi:type VI secretion system protein ImpE